jgi:hypothetical protein
LKEIGDDKNIKNEVMFGTDELINIMFKLFFLSNCLANLKVDGGIENDTGNCVIIQNSKRKLRKIIMMHLTLFKIKLLRIN